MHKQGVVRQEKKVQNITETIAGLQNQIDVLRVDIEALLNNQNTVARDIENKAVQLLDETVEKKMNEKSEDFEKIRKEFHDNLATLNSRLREFGISVNRRLEALEEKKKTGERKIPRIEMPEKPVEKPKPKFSKKDLSRIERAQMYIAETKSETATKQNLQSTVWHDVPASTIGKLLKKGVEEGHFIVKTKIKIGGRGRPKKLYGLPADDAEEDAIDADEYYGNLDGDY